MFLFIVGLLGGTALGWFLCRKFGAKADAVVKTINQ
jgi:hypothetical protein